MRLRSGGGLKSDDNGESSTNMSAGSFGSISGSTSSLEPADRSGLSTHSSGAVRNKNAAARQSQSSLGADTSLCTNSERCARNTAMNSAKTGLRTDVSSIGDATQSHTVAAAHSTSEMGRQREVLLPHNACVVWMLKIFGFLLVLFFFVIPAFIRIYPAIVVDVAFLNKIRWPPFIDLNKPTDFGLNYTRTFRLETAPGITVGAWHVLPDDLAVRHAEAGSELTRRLYVDLLKSGHPVILYLHGNAGTRAGWHRVQLYKVLANIGFHVVTFDYRGYGDSTGHPSEEGLVEDSISVFKWLKRQTGDVPVYVWGHSLGSGVATHTVNRLCAEGAIFNGLVLESPFNNFVEAASNHPFSVPFRMMPWFSWAFIEAIKLNKINFASDEYIKGVTVPVIILHALDDGIVPYHLGRKLYEVALRHSSPNKVEFVTFDGDHGYGHKHIHKSPRLVEIIRKFISEHNNIIKT